MNKVNYAGVVLALAFSMFIVGMYMHETHTKTKPNPNTSSVGSIR